MSLVLQREAIVRAIERAKLAWTEYPLVIDYENTGEIDLSSVGPAYLMVDIIRVDGEQFDLNPAPNIEYGGRVMLAAGAKDGAGTVEQLKLLDHFTPYLQLRDDLDAGVRTMAARPYPPRVANGFYYIPMGITYWVVEVAPPKP